MCISVELLPRLTDLERLRRELNGLVEPLGPDKHKSVCTFIHWGHSGQVADILKDVGLNQRSWFWYRTLASSRIPRRPPHSARQGTKAWDYRNAFAD